MNMTTTKAHKYGKIANVLRTAREAPTDVVALSRKNCHCKGVDSIVIEKRKDGSLVRVFVAHPGSALHKPHNKGLAVGIHNHRYPIRLIGLIGRVYNIEYSISPLHPTGGAAWDMILNAYRFGKMGSEIQSIGKRRVTPVSEHRVDDMILAAESLHTMVADCAGPAVWVVIEGPETTTETMCLSDEDLEQWSPEGFYGEFEKRRGGVAVLEEALKGYSS